MMFKFLVSDITILASLINAQKIPNSLNEMQCIKKIICQKYMSL